MSKIFYLKWY